MSSSFALTGHEAVALVLKEEMERALLVADAQFEAWVRTAPRTLIGRPAAEEMLADAAHGAGRRVGESGTGAWQVSWACAGPAPGGRYDLTIGLCSSLDPRAEEFSRRAEAVLTVKRGPRRGAWLSRTNWTALSKATTAFNLGFREAVEWAYSDAAGLEGLVA